MKAKFIYRNITLVCVLIIVSLVNLPLTIGDGRPDSARPDNVPAGGSVIQAKENDNVPKPGYRPIPDAYVGFDDKGKISNSLQYREWCENTFDNGNHIYEAYKNMTFNIKYTPEPDGEDYWQTPTETATLKNGDCEDTMLYFFSLLPSDVKNAEIAWGWIINKQSLVGRAHVWYQLTDKKGRKYVVEGFADDWSGIIPFNIVLKTEIRKPIFTISHCMFDRLSRELPKGRNWQRCQILVNSFMTKDLFMSISRNKSFSKDENIKIYLSDREYIRYSISEQDISGKYTRLLKHSPGRKIFPNVNKEIHNILEKLHEVFSRYEGHSNG